MSRIICLLIVLCLSPVVHAQIPGPASLFSPERASHTCVASGSWNDPATWTPATVPTEAAGSRVWIPPGTKVTIHGDAPAGCKWANVGGTLTCCDHCDIRFNFETIYTPMHGHTDIGTAGMPRTGNVILEITPGGFAEEDKGQWARGIISMGRVTIAGLPKTESVKTTAELAVGATSLRLATPPKRWAVGDTLLIAGTDSLVGETWVKYQSEYVQITGLLAASDGTTVTFSPPLKYRHFSWRSDLPYSILNLTRNVTVRSRDKSSIASRGHLMFMGEGNQNHIAYASIDGLGRTDKSRDVTDPRIGSFQEFVIDSDANPRGRYADHNHKNGQLSGKSTRRGVVVRGSPGWGMVNHASNCEWDNCIAVECFGAGFVTEEGQECGHMRRCVAAMNQGMGDWLDPDGRQLGSDDDHGRSLVADWGTDGAGFWLQGGLVEVSDCVSFDNSGRGFALFNRTMNGYPNYGSGNPVPDHLRFPIVHDAVLLTEEYAPMLSLSGRMDTPSSTVPQRVFARNTAYGNKIGVQGWSGPTYNASSQPIWPLSVRGSITDLTLWGRGAKLHLEYNRQLNVDGVTIVGDNGFRPAFNSISRLSEAVLLRSPEITVKNWSIEHVSAHMAKFRVEGPNDPGGIAGKNISIQGATVNADGSVTTP